ncbi:hypothetical protein ACUXV3_11085 [Roseobacteraceae bacterium NS-SX3]
MVMTVAPVIDFMARAATEAPAFGRNSSVPGGGITIRISPARPANVLFKALPAALNRSGRRLPVITKPSGQNAQWHCAAPSQSYAGYGSQS